MTSLTLEFGTTLYCEILKIDIENNKAYFMISYTELHLFMICELSFTVRILM